MIIFYHQPMTIQQFAKAETGKDHSSNEIRGGVVGSRNQTNGNRSNALDRPLERTCPVVGASVAGLLGCPYWQRLRTKYKEEKRSPRLPHVLHKGCNVEGYQVREIACEIADHLAWTGEEVNPGTQFVGQNIDEPIYENHGLECASICEVPRL